MVIAAGADVISLAEIAAAPRRVEGIAKVTGSLRYAADGHPDELGERCDMAVAIVSTQASGRIVAFDDAEARAMPGVRLVMTHENAPRLKKVTAFSGSEIGDLLPLQGPDLRYAGQCVAILVADTLENAQAAAKCVRIAYSPPDPGVAFTLEQGAGRAEPAKRVGGGSPGSEKIGRAERAFEAAAHQLDETFDSAPHHHNAMEPGAAIAAWDVDGQLTVHLPTQFSHADAMMLGQAFGFGVRDRLPGLVAEAIGGLRPTRNVRVVSTMAGGAFGGKLGNIHLLLAPMAAKLNGAPVKLVLSREQVFTLMPFRGETRQHLRLGADPEGRLEAIIDEALVAQGAVGQFVEPVIEPIAKTYAAPNILTTTKAARLDTNASGWMRGPGASVGQFALETGIDMLAARVGIDPLDVRMMNHADVEPDTGHDWSSKSLKACYAAGAEAIGWHARDPAVRAMRQGRLLVGYGMATASYANPQFPSSARVIVEASGHVTVESSSHEIGQGTVTAMSQIAAEALGVPVERVTFLFGDTRLPFGGMTVASATTLSNGAAIRAAALKVRAALLKRAISDRRSTLHRARTADLDIVAGTIAHRDGRAEPIADLVGRIDGRRIDAEASTGRDFGRSKYGRRSFGAQFARVLVDPDTCEIRVDRLVGAFAGGRIVNPLLARSQLVGGMVWGLGQALMEETVIDRRYGAWMNDSLGEALVPTHADVRDVQAIIVKEDDTLGHPLGVKGLGEIGVVGAAPAIGNAIFHATGVRLRSLPFRVDRLLAGMMDLEAERFGGGNDRPDPMPDRDPFDPSSPGESA